MRLLLFFKVVLNFLNLFSLISTGVCLTSQDLEDLESDTDILYSKFPPGFKWGLSTASYQVEGAWDLDGKGENIWDEFTHRIKSPIKDKGTGDIACDSYHKYEEDVKLLKDIGANSYRFSLSWSRLLPQGTLDLVNDKGIAYYKRLIKLLLQNGIEPVITLYHWDLPQNLQDLTGGWPNEEMIQHFANYAQFAFTHFGKEVKTWLTFNEPWATCLAGYGEGVFAPGIKEIEELPYQCGHNIIKAHAKAYRIYEKDFKPKYGGKVGIVIDAGWFEPENKNDPEDVLAAERALQFKHGLFASPLIYGRYPDIVLEKIDEKSRQAGRNTSRLPEFDQKWSKIIKGSVDFLGLNHYTSQIVSSKLTPTLSWTSTPSWYTDQDLKTYQLDKWPSAASSWLKVVPWGLRKILRWIKSTYENVEVIVTENGFSDPGSTPEDSEDTGRINYFREYTNQMLKAVVVDGCNVKGYFGWSLLDNFEWDMGYTERFGVHWVNFSDPERTRVPKKSATFLKNLFTQNGFVQDQTDRTEL